MTIQENFFTLERNAFGITRTEILLKKINKTIPWDSLVKKIETTRMQKEKGVGGRPRIGIKKLLKCLFLQGLYDLSDPEIEDQLRDRKSFQTFVGIASANDIPDETTICRFRNELTKTGFQEDIFTITQILLNDLGITVKKGSIQDATIIEAPKGKINKKGISTRDKDATFLGKNGRSYHGYKGHIETDESGKFIMNTTYTTASVHDSQEQDTLMNGDETELYGDSAYKNKNKEILYQSCGLKTDFNERGYRNNPLTFKQKKQNRIRSFVRARVEHPFAWIKTRYSYTKVRYRGLVKNAMHWIFIAALYNFDRIARMTFR